MQPSSILCRNQEALQRSRADAAVLENVRSIADKAANAWGKEAQLAEQRERRQTRTRVDEAFLVEDDDEADFGDASRNEDSDRGAAAA